jgi:hypothetical protein
MEIMPVYILTSVGLTITISVLAGINFAMMAFKIKRIKVMNSVKANSSALFGGHLLHLLQDALHVLHLWP